EGTYVVVRVIERREPQAMKLDEAREQVEKAVRGEQAEQNARKVMEELLQTLRKGERPWEKSEGLPAGVKVWSSAPFTFHGKGANPPVVAIRKAAFQLTMEAPIYPNVVTDGARYTLVRLAGIRHPVVDAKDPQQQRVLDAMRGELGEEIWDRYLAGLRQQSEIKVDTKVLESF
ncbi:MAG: hypothetical protein HQL66_13755, partial [Magnetococcales bacterium]|nr:hypothetical protein [Magnetococcales bacterium]